MHPRNEHGEESLHGHDVAPTIEALRAAVDVPVGVTTGEWILPDSGERIRAIRAWPVLPDFASVNFHEAEAPLVAETLLERGAAVEAGIWNQPAGEALAASGLADSCLRILLEPMDQTTAAATTTLDQIEAVLDGVAPGVPRLLHGIDATAWDLLDEAATRAYQGRMGLEDTLHLPDGTTSTGNADLVRTAITRVAPPASAT